ncbi:dimeric dUTPase (all-alpha-NTP-PPase superfamily) [Salirhabdus euzebyi]|uniref:Dimeric dUTPase (All-alpha-NTP-PPase superfamily) n=1 Tax=Salirhabdus euzebyi TaxID=394506 RepID=A0A841Q2Z8_9BACI|nr:dUTP diphosphatase [Salirhabdus euzebyi]MBB6452058.1 dimeric dUTPase (all-alpha-NTP-PPase superfamily) [Salirhabdus euzebyi]
MEWGLLYRLQDELDARIKQEHQLTSQDVVQDKILALLVELGELANETRCFKFWSKKGPSENAVILEEYVDGLHFILSLGLELGYTTEHLPLNQKLHKINVTNVFIHVYERIIAFQQNKTEENYFLVFSAYIYLGELLGFEEKMIQQAYMKKNEVNHARQDKGY